MSYQALYRKWRPKRFEEVIGQDPVITILKNQVRTGTVVHAYLFCGARGTGKTSTAKIFAKAISCLSPVEGEPCGTCTVCKQAESGQNVDILEIDAASNNGVDEIRELRDKVRFAPVLGRYKVYIIDEVHMLSTGAFNALLKTLEEPPEHVVFILATTEPHKLPATVLSRCQRFDFRRMSSQDIIGRLQEVLGSMDVQAEPEVLREIAVAAEGGMRDALSLLDQCLAVAQGKALTLNEVQNVLGGVEETILFSFVGALLRYDAGAAIQVLEETVRQGKDMSVLIDHLMSMLRAVMLKMACKNLDGILELPIETVERLEELAENVSIAHVMRAIEELGRVQGEMKYATQPRILLETALIRICMPQNDQTYKGLLDRLAVLEAAIQQGRIPQPIAPSMADNLQMSLAVENDKTPMPQLETKTDVKEQPLAYMPREMERGEADVSESAEVQMKTEEMAEAPLDAKACFARLLSELKGQNRAVYSFLMDAKPANLVEGRMKIVFPKGSEIFIASLNKPDKKQVVEEILEKLTGQKTAVVYALESGACEEAEEADFIKKARDLFGENNVRVEE